MSGGIAERARFNPQLAATFALVGLVYPFFEGIAWNGNYGIQDWLLANFGAQFHDFAGSVVVHAVGGWIALAAVLLLGARRGRYTKDGMISAHPPSNIPFLALGAWILTVGWFGFNVMSAQLIGAIRVVASGKSYLDPALTETVMGGYLRQTTAIESASKVEITARESEVLRLIALGHTNKEIAGRLELSVKTIEAHKANAMQKLGFVSRIDIVRFAILQGWMHDT